MKAIIFPHDENSALELAAAAASSGATELIDVRIGKIEGDTAANRLAKLDMPEELASDDAFDSLLVWFQNEHPDMVVASPTRLNKTIVGRLAAKSDASAIGNIVAIDGTIAQTRYFGGIGLRKEEPSSAIRFYYLADGLFNSASPNQNADIETIDWVEPKAQCKVISRKPIIKESLDLADSEVVISCGRGFSKKEDLAPVFELASKINAGVGCTRPLTEAVDWFPRDAYIGVSGQMIKPKVFIACGVSGQMQHMVGATNPQTIIAINNDKDAPIFKQCDIGIIGDVNDIIPALSSEFE